MKNKLKKKIINNTNYNSKLNNSTKTKKYIKGQANEYLTEVFTITEVYKKLEESEAYKNLKEEDKLKYELLKNTWIKIYNLNKKATTKEVTSLLENYIQVYKNSSKDLQDLFKGKLEKLLEYKGLKNLVIQIEQDGGLLKFWEKRLNIK